MFYLHYSFKPKLLPTLAFLVLFPFLLSLGFWQLGRMEEKQDMIDALALSNMGEAVDFYSLASAPLEYTKVKVLGKFLMEFSVLLEHQMHEGRPGYHVLTPFEISGDLPWMWVNRGWVALDNVPDFREHSSETFSLLGLIYYPSEDRFILGENISRTSGGQLKIQRMDFGALGFEFDHSFYSFVLLLDPVSALGFVRDWEVKTLPPSKHLGYAVQWFLLAGTLLVLFLFLNFKRNDGL